MKVFKFEVDEQFARENNELVRDNRQLRTAGVVLGIIVIIASILVYFFGANQAIWGLMILIVGTVLGIVFIIIGNYIGKRYNSIQALYDRYPLVPGMIAEVTEDNLTLMALVNTNADPELPPRWGLSARKIKAIPGIKEPKRGMQVPCAAVLAKQTNRDRGHWQEVMPMPIAWATPDEEVVNFARRSIPQEQWQKLQRGRDKLNDVLATPANLMVL